MIGKKIRTGIWVLKNRGREDFLLLFKLKFKERAKAFKKVIRMLSLLRDKSGYYLTMKYRPEILVILSLENLSTGRSVSSVMSVLNQSYKKWRLVLVGNDSEIDHIKTSEVYLKWKRSNKIRFVLLENNKTVVYAVRDILNKRQSADYVCFLDQSEQLKPNALFELILSLNKTGVSDLIYGDEACIDGEDVEQYDYKPNWSPDTLFAINYIRHVAFYKIDVIRQCGGINSKYLHAWEDDLVFKVTERTESICHLSKVLSKRYCCSLESEEESIGEQGKEALDVREEALKRRNIDGTVIAMGQIYRLPVFHVEYKLAKQPKVSIIIPSKDNFNIYKNCVESIIEKTEYESYEIITVDNGSSLENRSRYEEYALTYGIKYIYVQEEFNFSKMCNRGAANAVGELLLFLNDDTEVKTAQWLDRMAGQALLGHVGAVGAKLFYPQSNCIQHCGVVNLTAGPHHLFGRADDNKAYSFGKSKLNYNYMAVTGACLMIEKKKFCEIDGFDEGLPVAYNDIDVCFKLLECGYYNVQRNDVALIHYESYSRGDDNLDVQKTIRLSQDMKKLYERHPAYHFVDVLYDSDILDIIKDEDKEGGEG